MSDGATVLEDPPGIDRDLAAKIEAIKKKVEAFAEGRSHAHPDLLVLSESGTGDEVAALRALKELSVTIDSSDKPDGDFFRTWQGDNAQILSRFSDQSRTRSPNQSHTYRAEDLTVRSSSLRVNEKELWAIQVTSRVPREENLAMWAVVHKPPQSPTPPPPSSTPLRVG